MKTQPFKPKEVEKDMLSQNFNPGINQTNKYEIINKKENKTRKKSQRGNVQIKQDWDILPKEKGLSQSWFGK